MVAGLLAAGVRPVAAQPSAPLRIGVLDIRTIFERYSRIPELERQLQTEIARHQEQIRARQTSVEALERSARSGSSPAGAQALAQARRALRAAQQEAVEELRVLEEHATTVVLDDIRAAAAKEAAARELDLVIDRTDASMLFVRADGSLVVDVTEAVLARLNGS